MFTKDEIAAMIACVELADSNEAVFALTMAEIPENMEQVIDAMTQKGGIDIKSQLLQRQIKSRNYKAILAGLRIKLYHIRDNLDSKEIQDEISRIIK